MRTWSDSPFPREIPRAAAPEGTLSFPGGGESVKVYEIAGHPGWLAKLYRQPLPPERAQLLERVILLPAAIQSGPGLELIDRATAWPVSRITDGGRTVGVVMAKAPDRFGAELKRVSNRPAERRPLLLDWLVVDPARYAKVGLTPPDMTVRLQAMIDLLGIGTLFQALGLVYADWSYNNAFWDPANGQVFVIDMDSCGIGHREWIESAQWEDPLYPAATRPPLDCYSDRYKIAALVVRCLTGRRGDPGEAYDSLHPVVRDGEFGRLVGITLHAVRPADRPALSDLVDALSRDAAAAASRTAPPPTDGPNVTRTIPVGNRRSRHQARPTSAAHGAPPTRPRATNVPPPRNPRNRVVQHRSPPGLTTPDPTTPAVGPRGSRNAGRVLLWILIIIALSILIVAL